MLAALVGVFYGQAKRCCAAATVAVVARRLLLVVLLLVLLLLLLLVMRLMLLGVSYYAYGSSIAFLHKTVSNLTLTLTLTPV